MIVKIWRSAPFRWLLLFGAVIASLGWWLSLRPVSTVWGSVGEWVSGLATAGGLMFAGLEIHNSREQRKEEAARRREEEQEMREAMARAVGVQGIPRREKKQWKLKYKVHNGGQFPIDEVVLVMRDPDREGRPEDQQGTLIELILGSVMPGESVEDDIEIPLKREPVFGELTRLVGILFTDTWNNHWYRSPGMLSERPNPPRIC